MKELKAKYDFNEVEKDKYDFWLKGGFFEAGDKSKEPFTIVIPPPNVTGKLHLGHAWDVSLQDISMGKTKDLNIILKTDVQGSLGALCDALERMSNSEINLEIIHIMLN